MLEIDATLGEGGGQVLRTSLTLSMLTQRPIRLVGIRKKRQKPGLLRQHLTAVQAARAICCGEVRGAEINSTELEFHPQPVQAGHYHFAVGTAGSACLVFQTLFPALMKADQASHLILEGGTHNPWAPPFEFLEQAYLTRMGKLGWACSAELDRAGFYPAGGGRMRFSLQPGPVQVRPEWHQAGWQTGRAMALAPHLPQTVGLRELAVVQHQLGFGGTLVPVRSAGPGNALLICLEGTDPLYFCAFGERGKMAERVAQEAVDACRKVLDSQVAIDEHLADQLVLPLAINGGGSFTTTEPTLHLRTQLEIIRLFLDIPFRLEQFGENQYLVEVGPA